jgi:Ca2+-binding RTX toxin-like protein
MRGKLAILPAALAMVFATGAPADAAMIHCEHHATSCSGTNKADTIHGTQHRDSIYPKRGRDRVYARAGRDRIIVENDGARDVIKCGAGNDLVRILGKRERHDRYRNCERFGQ